MKTTSNDGLVKLAPGKWRARITWRDAAGKRHDTDRTITADTKLKALAERERIREELVGTNEEWTVLEAIAAFLPKLRMGTRLVRETHFERFSRVFGLLKLSQVKPNDIQCWLSGIDASDDTANNHRASLLALYKYARLEGRLVGENPVEKTVRRVTPKTSAQLLDELEQPAKKRALLGDELPQFFDALLEREPDLYPMARCQLLLGCRWSEVAALRWNDIDWSTGVVTIRRAQSRRGELGPPKGKRARSVALGPEGLAFMRGHRAAMERAGWPGCDVWAFPRPVTGRPRTYDTWPYTTAAERIRAVLRAAGFDLACSTHAFRHTHVTLGRALKSDEYLRASVGHTSDRMTEGYTDESHRKAVAQSFASELERRLAGGVFGGVTVLNTDKTPRKP